MERKVLLAYLQVAKRRARQGTKNLVRQKHVISKLASIGADTTQAESVLEAFQHVQNTRLLAMQQILNALDECHLDTAAAEQMMGITD
jgi:hypothetical protein